MTDSLAFKPGLPIPPGAELAFKDTEDMICSIACRHKKPIPPIAAVKVIPYLVGDTPYLRIEVFEDCPKIRIRRFTDIPLAHCDYLSVQSGALHRNLDVYENWKRLGGEKIVPNPADIHPKRMPHVFAIRLEGLRGIKLEWYGNREEDMNTLSQRALGFFATGPQFFALDLVAKTKNDNLYNKVKPFRNTCNEINRLRALHYGKTDDRKAPKDTELTKRLNQKLKTSPLYKIFGPGSLDVVHSPQPTTKKRKLAAAVGEAGHRDHEDNDNDEPSPTLVLGFRKVFKKLDKRFKAAEECHGDKELDEGDIDEPMKALFVESQKALHPFMQKNNKQSEKDQVGV